VGGSEQMGKIFLLLWRVAYNVQTKEKEEKQLLFLFIPSSF